MKIGRRRFSIAHELGIGNCTKKANDSYARRLIFATTTKAQRKPKRTIDLIVSSEGIERRSENEQK